MLKEIIRPVYRSLHDLLFSTVDINPLFSNSYFGKPVKKGHISGEHLAHPELDEQLAKDLEATGISVREHFIDIPAYRAYLDRAGYPESYYGGGKDPGQNFTEKTLEHYVSTEFIDFGPETVFVDIAACTSPFYLLVRELYGVRTSYQQDLIFPKGLHGERIGGFASEIPLPDASVDAATLHCSLEHFEGNSDTEFFQEMARVLKPGGKVVVLPFYLAGEYTIHVDPAFNLLRRHKPILDDPHATLRYADWYQFFSRHYDVAALKRRILEPVPELKLEVMRVMNFREVDPGCYLRFVGVFTRR